MQNPDVTPSVAVRRVAVLLAALLLDRALPAQDAAAPPAATVNSLEPRFDVTTQRSEMKIVERFSKVVETENRITTVDGFDPEVVNVTALSPHSVRVQALKPGITTMVVTDEVGEIFSVEVFVLGDVRHLQAYLSKLFPRSQVEAIAVQETVVLRGWVEQPEHITEIMEIAQRFYAEPINQMRVGGGQTIILKVKVMEVQRSKVRRLGFNFLAVGEDAFISSTPGALVPITALNTLVPGATPAPAINTRALGDLTSAFGFVSDSFAFQGFLDALKTEGLLKILAEPRLVTTNGRPANMLAGGEFPILVPQSLGTVTIEWREFGVQLEAVPLLLGQGRVRLRLQPEVSERDFANAVSVNGTTVPGLTTRRVNTEVEMRFGETYMLAGLLRFSKTAETAKVPFLGELPYIGAAFRRVRYEEGETELVILVTPELVGPMAPGQVPPGGPGLFTATPTDRELYWDGVLEVPNYGAPCDGCGPPGGPGAFSLEPMPRIHHVITGPQAVHPSVPGVIT
ncbi:MAG: type II and III secretion system protein family protein, partial [Planctomycetaceae bacterium]